MPITPTLQNVALQYNADRDYTKVNVLRATATLSLAGVDENTTYPPPLLHGLSCLQEEFKHRTQSASHL